MENTSTEFKPGMLVALCETWPTKRVIMIATVATVGKRDVKLTGSPRDRFKLTGQTWEKDGAYRWRAIKPLTVELYTQAEKDGASCLFRALGHVLPRENTAEVQ